jgi:hypothetical protein
MLNVQRIASQYLAGNPMDDPTERDLVVYVPPRYDGSDRHYPTLYLLHGFGMNATDWTYPFPHGGGLLPPIDVVFDAAIAKHHAAGMIGQCSRPFLMRWVVRACLCCSS